MLIAMCDDVYIRVHGGLFRVLAVATTDEKANAYMSVHEGAALLYTDPRGVHYIADKNDKGKSKL